MSTTVISSLQKNMIGVVTGGTYSTVADSGDLAQKADKVLLDTIKRNLQTEILAESRGREEALELVSKSIDQANSAIAAKADAAVIREIISQLALNTVKAELDRLFTEQLNRIQDSSSKEAASLKAEVDAFGNFTEHLTEQLTKMLLPVIRQLELLTTELAAVQPLQSTLKNTLVSVRQIETEASDLRTRFDEAKQQLDALIHESDKLAGDNQKRTDELLHIADLQQQAITKSGAVEKAVTSGEAITRKAALELDSITKRSQKMDDDLSQLNQLLTTAKEKYQQLYPPEKRGFFSRLFRRK